MGLKEWYKKKRGKILNKNEVEEPRFQMNKLKGSFRFSKNEGQRSLVLSIRSWLDPHMFVKENNLLLWE